MGLIKLTDTDEQSVLVRLDQVACVYPVSLYGSDGQTDFGVETVECTKISMINGDVLHVVQSVEDIFEMSQPS